MSRRILKQTGRLRPEKSSGRIRIYRYIIYFIHRIQERNMKKHLTSFIVGILFGVLVLNVTSMAVRGADSSRKGAVAAGLARGMGVNVPESLLNVINSKNIPDSETPASISRTHRASTIPAAVSNSGNRRAVLQTSAEQPVSDSPVSDSPVSDPFTADAETADIEELTPMDLTSITSDAPEPSAIPASTPKQNLPENNASENAVTPEDVLTLEESPAQGTASENPVTVKLPEGEGIAAILPEENSAVPQTVSANTAAGQQITLDAPAELAELPAETPVSELPAAEIPASSLPVSDSSAMQTPAVLPGTSDASVEMHPAAGSANFTANSGNSGRNSDSGTASGGSKGSGKPGEASLEGVQVTRVTIQKNAPAEIQVGKASVWEIIVKNEGKTDAVGVQIHDEIPAGTQLVNTYPAAQVAPSGDVVWNVGTMPAGTMASVKMELIPTQEGEIGSVASVTTRSVASAKTVATRPLLKVETFGDASILLGTATELSIVVSNPGTGVTRDVVLSETVPPELQFEGGAELLYKVGDLQPGESKTTKLPLTAVRPGRFSNKIVAKSAPNLIMESVLEMEVTAPALTLKLEGPGKRFLEKDGTYKLVLSNSGTAAAKNVEMKVTLPPGWKFNSANNFGAFLENSRTVMWKLEELGARETAEAEFIVTPLEIGAFTMNYEAAADICPAANGQKSVSVEGIAALMFQVVDSNDPIQVGEDTTYTVEVMNQGSKQAENVQVVVEIPSGLQVVTCDENARTANAAGGKQMFFNPIPTLGAKATKTYRFTLRGVASGDQRVAVKLSSREFQTPIVKEESTRVFTE